MQLPTNTTPSGPIDPTYVCIHVCVQTYLELGNNQMRVLLVLIQVPFQLLAPRHQPLKKNLTFVDFFHLACRIKSGVVDRLELFGNFAAIKSTQSELTESRGSAEAGAMSHTFSCIFISFSLTQLFTNLIIYSFTHSITQVLACDYLLRADASYHWT